MAVSVVSMTQSVYDALLVKDPDTLYVITDGADRTVLSGQRSPSQTDGLDGDFWIDTSAWLVSGPKNGIWPTAVSMKGPTGSQGPQGIAGQQGQQGVIGLPGIPGAKGDAGPTGPPGPQGPQGSNGQPGPAGQSGNKGDTGAQGAAGPQGPAGATGPTGLTGQGDTSDPFVGRGISPLPSLWNMSLNNSMVSGSIGGLFFRSNTARPCNRLAALVTTVAGAGPTLCRMGVYKVDPVTYAMTELVASTTNNPNLLTTIGWRADNITGGTEVVSGVWTPVVGRMYCSVIIHVSAAGAPSVAACATMMAYLYTIGGELLPMIYSYTGQADLGAALPVGAGQLNAALRGPNIVALFAP